MACFGDSINDSDQCRRRRLLFRELDELRICKQYFVGAVYLGEESECGHFSEMRSTIVAVVLQP